MFSLDLLVSYLCFRKIIWKGYAKYIYQKNAFIHGQTSLILHVSELLVFFKIMNINKFIIITVTDPKCRITSRWQSRITRSNSIICVSLEPLIRNFESNYCYINIYLSWYLWRNTSFELNKTILSFIIYRKSWKAISFRCIQLNPVQEMRQSGTKDRLYSTVKEKVATPVYQTKTSQSCWSFVTHFHA